MENNKIHKPPDKYTIIKSQLLNLMYPNDTKSRNSYLHNINDACFRSNEIVFHTYQFLRLFVIKEKQKINKIFIKITKDVVSMAMKVFIKETKRGRQVSGENKKVLDFFLKFYKDEYESLYNGKKIDGSRLSGIFNYLETEIVTAIENNVTVHFVDYLNRFVNCSFKVKHDKLLEKLKGKDKETLRNKLKNELKLVKEDFMENSLQLKQDPKYNNWYYRQHSKIFPHLDEKYKKSYTCHIKSHPQEYINCMMKMSDSIIEMGYNSFQFFPLRTEMTPKYIPLDSKILVELLIDDNLPKNIYNSDVEKYRNKIWFKIFNMNHKIFKPNSKSYIFDYRILTNGLTASIQFIHKSFIEKNNITKQNLKLGRENASNEYKDLKRDEIEVLKKNRQEKKVNFKTKKAETKFEATENYKKLNIDEQTDIKKKMKDKKYIEFPYLEELKDEQLKTLKKLKLTGKVIYVDPGKKNLLYMMNDDGLYFRYSNKERLFETKRLKYQKKIQKYKDENDITKIETQLSGFNSKSCSIDEFKKFIKKKNEVNIILKEKYKAKIFRKYKWYSFINIKRSEDNLLNKIEKVYGKDITLIYGDWSIGKQMRNFISTPNLGLKKKLATRFTIYSIDEFRTSKINYKSLKPTENLYLPDRKDILRKKHSILTYKTENGRQGCINRDKSAVNGMKLITTHFLETGNRHPEYKRENKQTIKAIDLETRKESSEKIKKLTFKREVLINLKNSLVSNVSKSPKGTF